MKAQTTSPKIQSIEWGKVVTEDGNQYKDVKLFPGGSRTWDWNETGTHHSPGIQPADIDELLEHGAETVVLSQGFHERLQVMEETKKRLRDDGIEFFIMETGKAVEKYNQLSQEKPAAALIHSTC